MDAFFDVEFACDDGVAHGDEDGAVGLAGHAAGFDRDGVGAVLEACLVDVHGWMGPMLFDCPTGGENESGPLSGPEAILRLAAKAELGDDVLVTGHV